MATSMVFFKEPWICCWKPRNTMATKHCATMRAVIPKKKVLRRHVFSLINPTHPVNDKVHVIRPTSTKASMGSVPRYPICSPTKDCLVEKPQKPIHRMANPKVKKAELKKNMKYLMNGMKGSGR